ncbi:MAG: type II secretion system protein [Aureliella sp.]
MNATRKNGFTLTELVVVILVVAILSSATLAAFSDRKTEAEVAATQRSLQAIQTVIDEYAQATGSYPDRIRPEWFAGDKLPRHPMNDIGLREVHVFQSDDRLHPKNKELTTGRLGAFWYNPHTGIIRARVRADSGKDETLKTYNRVNGSNLNSLSDID